MRRYMWPNSCLPSATALITAAQNASQGRFTLEGVENHAARKDSILTILLPPHVIVFSTDYPRTLREWSRRLDINLTQDMISRDYPALRDRADYDAFKRKWHYLFAYAGAGFAKGYITCHMLTFIRHVRLFLAHVGRTLLTLRGFFRTTCPSSVIDDADLNFFKIDCDPIFSHPSSCLTLLVLNWSVKIK